jgi:hypothetical protein
MGQNDITWGKQTAPACYQAKEVNKSKELTYLFTNIEHTLGAPLKGRLLALPTNFR